ncbi:MAG TPA: metal ABC transporter permease [Gammaproteobacteria bacterium]|nr:metal ABC transporter permease [Gammaproteobacteria bacterium]
MDESLLLSLVVAAFVGGAAAFLGSLMITRRMALVGDALGHVALPGMGIALVLGVDAGYGAFASLALGILAIWQLGEKTVLSLETLVGIVFVSSLAVGFLIVPEGDLEGTLLGDIASVSISGAAVAVVLSAAAFAVVKRIYPGMMLLGISQELAAVDAIDARRYNLIYLGAVALIVAVGVKVTGSLLVGSLVIVPPATARMLSTNMTQYARVSAAIGISTSVVGVVVARLAGFPPGPAIILVGAALFLLSLLSKRRGRL